MKRANKIREAMRDGAQLAIARDGYVYLLVPEKVDGRSVRSMLRTGELGDMSIEDLQRTWLRFFGHKEWSDGKHAN